MAIKIKLREPWTLHTSRIKMPIDNKDCIFYDTNGRSVNGQEILDAIGIAGKEVCFVRINEGKRCLNKVFMASEFKDGDFLDIYPFSIAG